MLSAPNTTVWASLAERNGISCWETARYAWTIEEIEEMQPLIPLQAVCDWPACAFAKELIEAYPNAKVILSTRDVDSWHAYVLLYKSIQKRV
jgi:hypothetical protein